MRPLLATVGAVRVLFLSTYELGHQPVALLGPAALAEAAGHEARIRDLSLEPLAPADVGWADAVVISVPMHTALRLAFQVIGDIRRSRPALPVALVGLYAGVAGDSADLGARDLLLCGEMDGPLQEWLADPRPMRATGIGSPTPRLAVPAGPALRRQLPPLDRYARLSYMGTEVPAAAVEASRGCSHKCRHCPVPVVYDGRTRVVEKAAVLAEIAAAVEAGARHITFSDPDFLNRPAHSRGVVAEMHASWPELTFDATVKVEHILRHHGIWAEMASAGCLFVVSAFESIDEHVLEVLDKGHTRAGIEEATALVRRHGIEIRPSLLPFTPWTTTASVAELVSFVALHDLVWNIDPVQYGIRLLLPPGSLLLGIGGVVLLLALLRALQTETASAFAGSWSFAPFLISAFAALAAGAGAAVLGVRSTRRPSPSAGPDASGSERS